MREAVKLALDPRPLGALNDALVAWTDEGALAVSEAALEVAPVNASIVEGQRAHAFRYTVDPLARI